MKVTIIPEDKIVIIDGTGVQIDIPPMPDIHAIQWSETSGYVEYKDGHNEIINSLDSWQSIIDETMNEIKRIEEASKPTIEREVAAKIANIIQRKRAQQAKPFENIAVTDALFDMQQVCRGLPTNNPIPTPPPFTGSWRTIDGSQRKFTCGEFIEFVDRVRERNARLWSVAQSHIDEVHRLADSNASIETIKTYDFSEGLS